MLWNGYKENWTLGRRIAATLVGAAEMGAFFAAAFCWGLPFWINKVAKVGATIDMPISLAGHVWWHFLLAGIALQFVNIWNVSFPDKAK